MKKGYHILPTTSTDEICHGAAAKLGQIKKQKLSKELKADADQSVKLYTLTTPHQGGVGVSSHDISKSSVGSNGSHSVIQLSLNYSRGNISSSFLLPSPPPVKGCSSYVPLRILSLLLHRHRLSSRPLVRHFLVKGCSSHAPLKIQFQAVYPIINQMLNSLQ